MKNIYIKIKYIGTEYSGWQVQNDKNTVQGTIQDTFRKIFSEEIKIEGSGRTDAGVHAVGQTANFHTSLSLSPYNIMMALNTKLPEDIKITECRYADKDFHARYNARLKIYRYQIYNSKVKDPFLDGYSYFVPYFLDESKIENALQSIIGTHDFRAFMASGSSVGDTVRTIYETKYTKEDDLMIIEVSGSGFLYNMVRIIAGTLVDIGRGRIPENAFENALRTFSRNDLGHTAPAKGLFLTDVVY